jgi:peptidoglycan/xylan/chitin deacetylase (PgdA/CDA1 family)
VNPEPIDGGWGDYMTMANLRELQGAGWSIVSHSYTHPDLTTLSADSLDKELRLSQKWVKDHGFGPTGVFVVPFHAWGDRERTAIAKYYTYARGYTVNQFFPALYQKWPITNPLDLSGFEPEYAPYKTAEGRGATMEIVDRAVKEGEFVDIFFHFVPAADLPEFTLLMNDIAKYKANIRTWAEVVKATGER